MYVNMQMNFWERPCEKHFDYCHMPGDGLYPRQGYASLGAYRIQKCAGLGRHQQIRDRPVWLSTQKRA